MKRKIYDSIVVGLGAMGSSSVYHLAKSGASVLGVDRFSPPHKHGSSHGESRVTREAYAEGFHYVKFVQRAHELWEDLEKEANTKLYLKVGGIHVGKTDSEAFSLSKAAAEKFNIRHKVYTVEEINKMYKFFNFPENKGLMALIEENAGVLFPEKCVEAHLSLAKKHGAELKTNASIDRIVLNPLNKTVILHSGKEEYETKNVVLSCGSWLNEVLSSIDTSNSPIKLMKLELPLKIEKNFFLHFKFKKHRNMEEIYKPFPIYMYQPEGLHLNDLIYGFPDIGGGNHFKVALYHLGKFYKKYGEIDRTITAEDRKKLYSFCKNMIAGFNEENVIPIHEETCLYTTTPDYDFIMDFYPENDNIFICSPCSGHGFKFSSRVGEYVKNLITKKETLIKDFSLNRLIKV